MSDNKNYASRLLTPIRRALSYSGRAIKRYWQKNWWHKVVIALASLLILIVGTMYGIARWYIYSESSKPLTLGVSFIPDYASSLGLDPKTTMDAIINDLHVKQFRLVSYWSDIEPTPGHYDFSMLDWEFSQAAKAHASVTLAIGLRQPRWPECHAPAWVNTAGLESSWVPELDSFMTTVINRYKNNPALASYQLENEFFNKGFGQCYNFDRSRLVSEFNLVKKTDPNHPVIISRSNNYLGLPIGSPRPDISAISVYRRVWSPPIGRYFEYPFPAWYYAFLAGANEILTGKDSILHELQAEPWPPNGESITNSTLAEQNKSMNAKILTANINFAKATGMRTIDLWGAEYWYYRDVKLHDPSLWNTAKREFASN